MTLIAERLVPILRSLPQGVRLAAVSKFHPVEELMEAYEAGQRVFAESRVQELMSKVEAMPDDVEWHFIGPLQTNKVKYIVPFISMIQSVSSLKLFDEISRQASKVGRTVPVLLEVHIASEDTKSGFTPEELPQVLEAVLARLRYRSQDCRSDGDGYIYGRQGADSQRVSPVGIAVQRDERAFLLRFC